jgi:RNA polymerase sigma-70 factor (ECF subfamily)
VNVRDVEDIAHEVFLRVHEKFATFAGARPIRPWLFGFCFRAASDYRRLARHRREWIGDAGEPPDSRPLADEAVARKQEATLVARALDSIDLDRRAVLVAFELDEIPMKEIAENLGVPLQTAYSRLRVAREEFASAVRRLRLIEGSHAQR